MVLLSNLVWPSLVVLCCHLETPDFSRLIPKSDTSISHLSTSYSTLHQLQSAFISNCCPAVTPLVPLIKLLSNRVSASIMTRSRVSVILWFTILLMFGSDNRSSINCSWRPVYLQLELVEQMKSWTRFVLFSACFLCVIVPLMLAKQMKSLKSFVLFSACFFVSLLLWC